MSAFGSRTARSAGFVSALLLTTALASPAFAEIEEVVVTAQKTSQDIQTVPIAISAFTAQDLQAHQIERFNDLQFSTPSVSYTKGNFTGSDFQIRGIGITAVGYDSESGVAINFNDVFLSAPNIADGSFYDLERIEVLRGPQSTLYGRGATGGVVNVVAAKPDLDAFGTNLEASYGNYNAQEYKGYVNIPLDTDHLAARISGDYIRHDGYATNLYDGTHPDNRNEYSVRGELRWQPTQNTTVDFTAQFARENDNKMRSQKQLCNTDPTGVLGCLPTGATAGGLVNANSNLSVIASSIQGLTSAFGAGLGSALGLSDLTVTPTLPPGTLNPSDPHQIYSNFNPTYHAEDNFMGLNWKQTWAPWLDSTAVVGYDQESVLSQESYNNVPGTTLPAAKLAVASATFLGTLAAIAGPAYAANYAPFFAHPGMLPISTTTNFGTVGNSYTYTGLNAAYDQSNGFSTEWSGELRFNTKFNGPLNAMFAIYYLQEHSGGDYFVNAPTLDYPAILIGGLSGASGSAHALCPNGCIDGPGYYHNDGEANHLTSKAVYGEVHYDALPDLLNFIVGVRYTEDTKTQQGRIALFSGLVPIGTTNEDAGLANLTGASGGYQRDFDCSNGSVPGTGASSSCGLGQPAGPNDVWQFNSVKYDKLTGRAVANWTPTLDFTDKTDVYMSFAKGYKAGGFNPGVQPGLGVPSSYGPESIDAYELGAKNTIFGGTMQANADVWYYDYTGLQVSKIENNTSVNENINATLYGVEGTLLWAPDDRWQFNLAISNTNSSIGDSTSIDPRNPSAGYAKALLIKDGTLGSTIGNNCVLYYNGATPGTLPVGFGFFAPAGGIGGLAAAGIPYSAYGTCLNPNTQVAPGVTYGQALAAQGFSTTAAAVGGTYGGVPVSLKGNQLQNTPPVTLSIGGQYTLPIDGGYHLVGRADYYWQTDMYGRIFNGPADKIAAWDMLNMSVQLNAPDNVWYVKGYIKNVMNKSNLTGEYLTSPTSGLYTNGFYTDPRTYGITVGVNF